MKKSKLSIGLVTSFIAAMALTGCNEVTAKDKALVTFTPYGSGETVEIVSDEMYNKYMNTTDGISKFYSQILEVLIRYDFKKNGNGENGMLTLSEIEEKAANNVKEEKKKARDAGDYDTEWKNILDSYSVENEKELKEQFIYKLEKDEISKYFLNNNIEQLRKEFIGVDKDGNDTSDKVDSVLPYHIRHILVKTEAAASDFTRSTISSTEANKLYNVISKLKDGKLSFAQVAYDESDDNSGKDSYGDVGIVTNQIQSSGKLTMVNEFQLGIYAYDAILSGKSNETIAKGLGVKGTKYKTTSDDIATAYQSITGLVKVPYDAVLKLNEYKDLEKDEYGNELSDGNPIVYPRNIIWNKYFNNHQVFVITNAKRNEGTNGNNGNESAVQAAAQQFMNVASTTEFEDLGARFVNVPEICANSNEKVLTDGNGNVILGVRSEFGIHLIVIQKSIYDFDNADVSLEEYYTTEVPSSSKYPKTTEGVAKNTYVNFINTTSSTDYNKRANDVKDKIKAFDSTYDYRLYEKLMKDYEGQIKFSGEEGKELDKAIARYLDVTRNAKAHTQETKLNAVWEEYLEMLTLQQQKRETYYATSATENKTLMVPEGCAVNFKTGGEDYKEGGKCYYAK